MVAISHGLRTGAVALPCVRGTVPGTVGALGERARAMRRPQVKARLTMVIAPRSKRTKTSRLIVGGRFT